MGTSIESGGGVTIVPKTSTPVPDFKPSASDMKKLDELNRIGKAVDKLKQDGWDGAATNAPTNSPAQKPSAYERLKEGVDSLGKVGDGACAPKGKVSLDPAHLQKGGKVEIKKPLGCPPEPLESPKK